MFNNMQKALIRKDLRSVTTNKRLFPALIIVPLVMAVIMPFIFIIALAFAPLESSDLSVLVAMLPADMAHGTLRQSLVSIALNSIIPLFFLIIPVMAASIMAASAFVGEKEKQTLETLLYCPLTLSQIFSAKILASFTLSMMISFLSFITMVVVVEIEVFILLGVLVLPDISWFILLVLVSPAITLISITIIVRGSAKAQTMEESQQRSVFLIIPIFLLMAGQFTGVLLLDVWVLLAFGVVLAAIAWFLMRRSFSGFSYESLLL